MQDRFSSAICVLLAAAALLLLTGALRADGFAIERVSVSSTGEQSNATSSYLSVSSDGRFIVFLSSAANLVSDDTNNAADVFLHDRQTGETARVSLTDSGTQMSQASNTPNISADGRHVVFITNNYADIFVRDLQTNHTSRANVSSSGTQANQPSDLPAISANGRYVVFASGANNLVANDTNGNVDVFVHDMQTGVTTRISVSSLGAQSNNISDFASISADGRYIAFESYATNLVPDDTNGSYDVFVHDMQTGETSRVSVSSLGTQGNNFSTTAAISANGRYISFESNADNLVTGDTNGFIDIFVHDTQTSETSRVSVSSLGVEGNGNSLGHASLSTDGRYITFRSNASNLVTGDTNGFTDIFVHDTQTGETSRVSVSSLGTEGNSDSQQVGMSADGGLIAFSSLATNLVAGDTNNLQDIFAVSNILPPSDPPNAAPILNYFASLPITLTWNPVSGIIGYQVQVATDRGFAVSTIVLDTTTSANQLYVTIRTIDNGSYFWRVCGRVSLTKCGAWSTPDSFTVAVP